MSWRAKQAQGFWKRAQDCVTVSERDLHDGFPDFATSHAYYAVFYAASALLVSASIKFSKHTSVVAAIHRDYVKPGKLPEQAGETISALFRLRAIADYGGTQHVATAEAEKAVRLSKEFMELVRPLVPLE